MNTVPPISESDKKRAAWTTQKEFAEMKAEGRTLKNLITHIPLVLLDNITNVSQKIFHSLRTKK